MYNLAQIKSVTKILKKNKTNYWTGNECKKFEKEFSNYHNTKYSIAVSNGSVALEIALKVLDLKKRDKVIVTPRSFIISASCVLNLGLKPIFADVDENGNMSIDGILKAYNKSVKAIIVVHFNGLPCNMDPIVKFVNKKKLHLIEDCSQAHGATYKGKKVGSFGSVSTWSFCQDKIISTGGEGGMISTNKKNLWERLWSIKDHGKNYQTTFFKKHKVGFRWLHENLGSNYRMTEMQAAIGRIQLKLLNRQIKKRNQIANMYLRNLNDYFKKDKIFKKPNFYFQNFTLNKNVKNQKKSLHAFYRLNFFINDNQINQMDLIKKLNNNKINCGVGACPEIYNEKIFQKLGVYPKNRLKNAKLLGETSVMFPINPYRSLGSIKKEINDIKKILNKYH